jgi:hypothetical protein
MLTVTWPACAQQWTAVRLHPDGTVYSEIRALGPGVQAGSFQQSSADPIVPVLWQGSSTSLTPLVVGPQVTGDAFAIWTDTQVGDVNGQAALWHSTPESFVNLRPTQLSEAAAVRAGMQVGYAFYSSPGQDHAALWRGTAASYVDLHPAGAVRSFAYATDGVLQGGEAQMGPQFQQTHAALWNGTAASFTDLSGGVLSHIRAMSPGIQAGWIDLPTAGYHAAVWHGSAGSLQDFNGPLVGSRFFATTGRVHVGDGGTALYARAVINFGTPNSWLELHQFLPPGYTTFSGANAVYQDGPTIYVGGYAVLDGTFEQHAFLWIGTDPCYPNCDHSTTSPALNVLDFGCFLNNFAAKDGYANCDGSTTTPALNVLDFICFLNRFAAGCS